MMSGVARSVCTTVERARNQPIVVSGLSQEWIEEGYVAGGRSAKKW
jgi:hypothetical protein